MRHSTVMNSFAIPVCMSAMNHRVQNTYIEPSEEFNAYYLDYCVQVFHLQGQCYLF